MQIKLQSNEALKAFINVAGTHKETPIEEYNKLMEEFVTLFNQGKLEVAYFKNAEGKLVLGFR